MTMKSFSPLPAMLPEKNSPVAGCVSGLGQHQYAVGLETACAWLRHIQTIVQTQQQAVHQALNAYELTAQKLRSANAPANLLNIPMDWMGFFLENPIRYCEQLATSGLQAQIELMARFNHWVIGNTKEHMGKALSNFQASLPASPEPFEKNFDIVAGDLRAHCTAGGPINMNGFSSSSSAASD